MGRPSPGVVAAKAQELIARGYAVGLPPEYRITRGVAAIVLQRSAKTLANWKSEGVPLKQYTYGGRGRVFYNLADVLSLLSEMNELDPAA